jgi:glycine C-acetyltransferase
MKRLGFVTGVSTAPITTVMVGEALLAQHFSRELFEAGVFAMAHSVPIIPLGKARIRVMISAAQSKNDLELSLEAFNKVGENLGYS